MSPFSLGLVLLSAAMHASWNLLVRDRRAINMFLSISIGATVLIFPFLLLLEFILPPVLWAVPWYLVVGGILQAVYYMGMTNSYHGGDFTVAYPLARGLPVLMVAVFEASTGDAPSPLGWMGILLIVIGAVLVPLRSLRELTLAHYWNRTTFWILFAAVGIAGSTLIDRAALLTLPNGLAYALRYSILESVLAGGVYFVLLRLMRAPIVLPATRADWKFPLVAMFFVFVSYSLILWAFQSDDRASYVIGLRQISIVLGVIGGSLLFHERGARLRIPAAVIITTGVILLSLA